MDVVISAEEERNGRNLSTIVVERDVKSPVSDISAGDRSTDEKLTPSVADTSTSSEDSGRISSTGSSPIKGEVNSARDIDSEELENNGLPRISTGTEAQIAKRMIIRREEDGAHVVLVGSVSVLDPMKCPYTYDPELECAAPFLRSQPDYLKYHFQSVHRLQNVRINLLCPYLREKDGGVECRAIVYDPQGSSCMLGGHVSKQHPVFRDKMMTALAYRNAEEDQRRELLGADFDYLKTCHREVLPDWIYSAEKEVKFPSLRIPESLDMPIVIVDKDKLGFVCNRSPCQEERFPNRSAIFDHFQAEHRIHPLQTTVYEVCPAASQGCTVKQNGPGAMLEEHIQFAHPTMLGLPAEFAEKALQKWKQFEEQARSGMECSGRNFTIVRQQEVGNGVDPGCFYEWYCPVEGCCQCYGRESMLMWHIGVHHKDK
ncbi:uncharacterized protein LOC129594214 [Paramacrobiotus metropolitanus]|uniref:uncharacterized protein LOC129594214 n=1 Tax=Paramacrobiotus metropolitanus TaxID=2943436 RepID=UPI0024456FBC|nr:uncharacterized protein LOC129594214 [Paramacrobiotus metropolitanus]XP_055346807.1 uncharacterized protein LOC129594214 [Paramacrobiotus metropolitanus]